MDTGFIGLASLGFWLFIGACVVGGIWDGVRKREAQHETLRRIVESGKTIDQDLMDHVLGNTRKESPSQDLKVAGLIVTAVAPGLLALGFFVGEFTKLMGVAALVGFVGIGLLTAAWVVDRDWQKDRAEKDSFR